MKLEDEYKLIIAAYYGVREMDNYDLKVYVLKDIENYAKNFIEHNPISRFDYQKKAEEYDEKFSLRTKLQDSLIILNRINGPIELILMIKQRLKEIK